MLAAAGHNHCRERSISFAVSGQFKVAAYTRRGDKARRSPAKIALWTREIFVRWG
ncbi:hypothetical protein [Arthrobacter sp. efr-133-TYG-118]|uniref:hypothetical protein n=1 Tax=Arthrobacter sp. efr-133-TYG-118 TaxID=3040279 RepID=UPI00254ACE92|nr:hypothetical protein [Arthrobacter sp. efr-133-TYG-118]